MVYLACTSYLLIFQEMEKEYSGVVFIKVDVDENEVRTEFG